MNIFRLFDKYQAHTVSLDALVQLLQQKGVKYSRKNFASSVHVRCVQEGLEIEYVEGQLNTIFLYLPASSQMKPYQYSLPFTLTPNITIKWASMLLGEPTVKSKHIPECIYPHLGLGIVFKGSWENENSTMEYLYLYPAEAAKESCSLCHKCKVEERLRCRACKVVGYCKQECKEKHFSYHKMICVEID